MFEWREGDKGGTMMMMTRRRRTRTRYNTKCYPTDGKVLCKYVNLHRFVLAKEKKGERNIVFSG